jgi:ABC-2 type transport system permease protein
MIKLTRINSKIIGNSFLAGTKAIFNHELRLLIFSPLSYLFQLGFLLTLSACVFLIADFYSTDEASIRPLLTFLPWVSLILVPALAMRSWTDEHSDRSVELTMTLPVHLSAVVIGKFLSGYTILLVTLFFTLPIAATIYYLGDPDLGVLFSGYLASALMLAVYYAISLFAAALSRDQIGAFIISLVLLFILLLFGWDVFGRLLHGQIPPSLIETLSLYSPKTWLDRLSRGLIDFPGIFYAIAVTTAALIGSGTIIRSRYQSISSTRIANVWFKIFIGTVCLGLLIPFSTHIQDGLDMTAEKEFTPHQGTLKVLKKLSSETKLTLYWSAQEPSVPPQIKSHAERIKNLLRLLATRSDGRLLVQVINPLPDTDEELKAQGLGIKRIPMSSGDHFYLGMTFQQDGRISSIPYLDIQRDRHLEYDIALGLNGLARKRTPKIGIISPLIPSTAAIGNREGMSFISELKRSYDIAIIPHFKNVIPDGLDVLLLIDTTILRSEMLYAIDQFVMNGGGLVVMMDPYLRFNRASNVVNPSPSNEINDISDILQRYGIKFLGNSVIGDSELASVVAEQSQKRMSFPFWMRIPKKNLSEHHPATADLNEVFMVEAGALEITKKGLGGALITTTNKSGSLDRNNFINKKPRELAKAFVTDKSKQIIAAYLKGPYKSAFNESPKNIKARVHLEKSNGVGGPIFVIADVDWLFDPFSLQKSNIGGQLVVRPLNDNLALLLNMIEYASGDAALIAIRSRGKLKRPFKRVAQLFLAAEEKFKEQELLLAKKVSKIEKRISQYSRSANNSKNDELPLGIREDLKKFRMQLLPARRALRNVRLQIRNEVNSLGRRLTLLNLLAGPVLVAIWGLWIITRRKRKHFAS